MFCRYENRFVLEARTVAVQLSKPYKMNKSNFEYIDNIIEKLLCSHNVALHLMTSV